MNWHILDSPYLWFAFISFNQIEKIKSILEELLPCKPAGLWHPWYVQTESCMTSLNMNCRNVLHTWDISSNHAIANFMLHEARKLQDIQKSMKKIAFILHSSKMQWSILNEGFIISWWLIPILFLEARATELHLSGTSDHYPTKQQVEPDCSNHLSHHLSLNKTNNVISHNAQIPWLP